MYCEFYGFREKPFTITPNPRFIFLSKNHREAFAHLLYGIDNHAGFIKLTGEVGTGKTTVLRTLFEQLDERGHRTALIFNPCLTAEELMRCINREFGIPSEGLNITGLLDSLNNFLLSENAAGRTVVLVIDEAQNLEPRVLEQIRLISNLETKTDKLIQIILAGQPELALLLGRTELRQLSQRITVSYHLTPMDFEDTKAYIEHRLEVAGDWRAAVFTPQAFRQVFRYSGGVPRLINILCDRILLLGYVAESREISGRTAKDAIAETRKEENIRARLSFRRALAWGLTAIAAATVFILLETAPGGFSPFRPAEAGRSGADPAASQFPVLLGKELGSASETESARNAFNAVMKRWNASPVADRTPMNSIRDLEEQATGRGLKLTRYNGSLGLLVRMDYPAILEFSLPGISGKRYLALTGIDRGRYLVTPSLAGRDSLSTAELESIWSGAAWIAWKNFRTVSPLASSVKKGAETSQLQHLLRESGAYKGDASGSFDKETAASVRAFQAAHGIAPDGKAGAQTLLLLYRSAGKYPIPTLDRQEGNRLK